MITVTKAIFYKSYRARYGPTDTTHRLDFTLEQYPCLAQHGSGVPELYALRLVNELNRRNAELGFTFWLEEAE